MRTTVNLDDDVFYAVKEQSRRENRSAGQVLSELARQALAGHGPPAGREEDRYGFRPLPQRGPCISNALIDRLREEEGE